MIDKDYDRIFAKLKKNSIGVSKRVKNKRIKIKASLKRGVATFLSIMTVASMAGCGLLKQYDPEKHKTSKSWNITDTWNGYTYDEINNYEEARLDKVLSDYNMTDYTKNGYKRSYNYTAKDYMNVVELDETYMHGFYHMTDSYTVNQFCISQGYKNFEDYLGKNGYTNSDGKTDINKWIADDLEIMSKMMDSREVGKTK